MEKLLCLLSICSALSLCAQSPKVVSLERRLLDNGAIISRNNSTGTPSFIRFTGATPLQIAGASLSEKASIFFEAYGEIYKMQDMGAQLFLRKTITDATGGTHLMYGQTYQGIPVFGSDFRLHFNARNELTAVNGVVVPGIATIVVPVISAEKAAEITLEKAAATYPEFQEDWVVLKTSLSIFRKGLVQGLEGNNHLVYEITVFNGRLREFLYVDAANGNIVEQFPGTCEALYRRLYVGNSNNQIWQEGDPFPGSLTTWQQNELNATEDVYNFFKSVFGHTSYDDGDAEMKVVHAPSSLSCPSAMWNGFVVNVCDQVGTDDLMAHEWGHAYTEFTNNLLYAWQTGALNESYSDIWGETIDLLSPDGNDNVPRTGCSSSQLRWQLGEAATGFGTSVRDLWNPTCKLHPGKVTDTEYTCSSGVHVNSGVSNHSYALLTDGGTYNGQTITGLGLTKAAHIYWQVQTAYLTNTSNYMVMADALETACADLIGTDLEGLTISSIPLGPSGQIITADDCLEVVKVNNAVQFRTHPNTQPEPGCNFGSLLGQAPPNLCGTGAAQSSHFFDNFESGLGNWTITQIPSNPGNWTSRQWVIDASPPGGHSGSVVYCNTPDPSYCNPAGDENGIVRMQSPVISIPGGVTAPVKMTFDQYISMDPGYDGGNLKYRLNGGAWTIVPSAAFTYNAYIYAALITNGSDSPLAGQPGFSAADPGTVTGTWGQSQLNLANIGVLPGSNIEFRFELGTNSCIGWDGWYIDNVHVYTCELLLPVELLSFGATASVRSVSLEWATATESQNAGFELQRSTSVANGFEKIAFVPSNSYGGGGSKYHFTDVVVQPGQTYYYRLRQLDIDGRERFSPVVSAKLPAETQLLLQPNPAGDFLDIHITGNVSPEMDVQLFDMRGATLFATKANGAYRLDLAGIVPGVYLVKVMVGGRLFLERFVKH